MDYRKNKYKNFAIFEHSCQFRSLIFAKHHIIALENLSKPAYKNGSILYEEINIKELLQKLQSDSSLSKGDCLAFAFIVSKTYIHQRSKIPIYERIANQRYR